MKRLFLLFFVITSLMTTVSAKPKTITLKFIETSDVHGSFFPVNYLTGKPAKGSMARISSYVKDLRKQYGENLILLENGDILQGQPTNYYWNFINTEDENIAASIVNYINYDAQTFGNHDIEATHKVYDKWVKELNCPVIAANVVNAKTGEPYTKPYIVINRGGVKIAILGMLTAAIPNWLSEDIWEGLSFEEMVSSSRKWMKIIKEEENPDLVIGLFHSGREGGIVTPEYGENVTELVAKEVPGFDIIFYGHDHTAYAGKINDCWIVDPSNAARYVGESTVTVTLNKNKVVSKNIECSLTDVNDLAVDEEYMKFFSKDIESLSAFCNKKIGNLENDIFASDAFFGSSALCDLILNMQMKITGADVAFNAPLSFNNVLRKGNLTMADMFNLYKYENKLYVMRLTGKEIKGHLEMSYALWTKQMKSADDTVLLLADTKNSNERAGFKNPYFNFDSAGGIDYTVDVTKPEGEKITILRMSNGEPFYENKWYKVAINSYRGNGGGELLTRGAGIPKDSLESRIIYRTELDQRYYLMKEIEELGTISPKPNDNWKFVPEEWAKPALERDRKTLFKN